MGSTGLITRYLLLGAIAFWLPDIVMNAIKVESLYPFIFIPVLGLLAGYVVGTGLWRSRGGPSLAIFMLLGVWLFSSTAMGVGATFSGGGFALGLSESIGTIIFGLLPPYTMIMATYDGSLFALIIAFAVMPIAHFLFEMDHWILSPRLLNKWRKWYEHRVS